MTIAGMLTSNSAEWSTPAMLYDRLHAKHSFVLDVCASEENKKCAYFFSREEDAMKQNWAMPGRAIWMNPPYGRGIGTWVAKAYETSLSGTTVVCLLPARTDTSWWHDFCTRGEIEFLKGRLRFSGHKENAPFPSAVVVFKGKKLRRGWTRWIP